MKLSEYIKRQEESAQRLRTLAEETREGAEWQAKLANGAADPATRRWSLRLVEKLRLGANTFDHRADEVERKIEELRQKGLDDNWDSSSAAQAPST